MVIISRNPDSLRFLNDGGECVNLLKYLQCVLVHSLFASGAQLKDKKGILVLCIKILLQIFTESLSFLSEYRPRKFKQ